MVGGVRLAAASTLLAVAGLWTVPAPLVIAHRGASGYRPEHTIEAYALAIEMGADAIEPDLVSTKDHVLIARHENEIGATTDVAEKFPDRKTTRTIDGTAVTGWFTEDFTLDEIRTLRARERLEFRSHDYDGQFLIPTFKEVLDLAERSGRAKGRTIAVYPETKHPTHFRSLGLPLEEPLLAALNERGWRHRDSPVFIQSFEASSLVRLRPATEARLVMLVSAPAAVTPDRLSQIRVFADGIGVEKRLLIPVSSSGQTLPPTSLVADAHKAGLFVHVWTLRAEPRFLPASYGGDMAAEVRQLSSLGVDGLFTDFPDVAVQALAKPR